MRFWYIFFLAWKDTIKFFFICLKNGFGMHWLFYWFPLCKFHGSVQSFLSLSLSSVHFRVNIPFLFWFLKGKSDKACGKPLFPSNIRILFHFVEPPLQHENLIRNSNYRPVSLMNSETKIHKKILVNNFSIIHNQYMLSPSGLYPWYEMKAQYSSIRCCKSLHQKR